MHGKALLIVRRLHLYLSVFFAPLLLVFVITGWAQTMNFDHSNPFLNRLSEVHTRQFFPTTSQQRSANGSYTGQWNVVKTRMPNEPVKWLVAVMCVALIISIVLGLVMAFTMARQRVAVCLALFLGVTLPIGLLALAHFS